MSTTPSISPPRTPDDRRLSTKSTPNSDDSSIIDDLSFDYIQDSNGNIVRLSRGSSSKSNHSSPPTPQEALQPDIPTICEPKSPDLLHASPLARISLSRSEGAFPVLTGPSAAAQSERPARSFQRVASGPTLSQTLSYLAPTTSSVSKPRVAPRRVTMEDARERQESISAPRARQTLDSNTYSHVLQEEKENISESDEIPNIEAASATKKQRRSPPLVTRSASASLARLSTRVAQYGTGGGRPLADVSLAQRAVHSRVPPLNRAARLVKSTSLSKYNNLSTPVNFDRISEAEISDNEHIPAHYPPIIAVGEEDTEPEDELAVAEPGEVPLSQPVQSGLFVRSRSNATSLSQSGSRPRRSASLSDALKQDDYQLQLDYQYREPSSRPGTSSGIGHEGLRRLTPLERERQDADLRSDFKRHHSQDENQRESPSPTHNQALQSSKATQAHKRRDSDTLRTLMPSASAGSSSPTVVEPRRASPPSSRLQTRYSPPGSLKGRVSPPSSKDRLTPPTAAIGRTSPPVAKGRLSPASASNVVREIVRHRRSPTAPQPPTTSASMRGREEECGYISSGERAEESGKERELEKDLERERKWQQLKQLQQQQRSRYSAAPPPLSAPAIPQAAGPAPPPPAQLNRHIVVNKKAYARLDMIGKGGSSRVFRVLNHASELFAIKRVTLDKIDPDTMNGFMNEIALLKRLEGNSRIIRLFDSEVKPGPGGSKGHLLLVMECGEVDLNRLLQEQMKEPVNMVWVAYYWQQMLQAVHVIHQEKIVHSDLKPANFVLVRGQLKLIDFGIANAIANDTTNIQRDNQVGTVNYMSPETIELPEGMRRLKVGRPSDVWSLGCILYQMIYGYPPFQHLSMYQRMRAIPDLTHVIEFPEYATPIMPSPKSSGSGPVEPPKKLDHLKQRVRRDVIMSMKSCLCRNPKERATIPDLMNHSWLSMSEPSLPPAKDLLKEDEAIINPYYMHQLLAYGVKLASEEGIDPQSLLKDAERLVQELKSIQP